MPVGAQRRAVLAAGDRSRRLQDINDTHGHAAGDACLQHFTLMAQTRLRPGDMLARTGGDEFCVVLPASTLREGAMIARRILDVCREDAAACVGADIPISISIGVAQWTRDIGAFPDRLIAAADQALYAAKNERSRTAMRCTTLRRRRQPVCRCGPRAAAQSLPGLQARQIEGRRPISSFRCSAIANQAKSALLDLLWRFRAKWQTGSREENASKQGS